MNPTLNASATAPITTTAPIAARHHLLLRVGSKRHDGACWVLVDFFALALELHHLLRPLLIHCLCLLQGLIDARRWHIERGFRVKAGRFAKVKGDIILDEHFTEFIRAFDP